MTVTSGNVSHPEDEAMGSLMFWSSIRALILVSPEDLEADPNTDKKTPLWAVQKVTLEKEKLCGQPSFPLTYIHRANMFQFKQILLRQRNLRKEN